MKVKIIVTLMFLIAAAISLYLVYFGKLSQETAGILANLGTGFIGTVLTVLIVDWMYERRASQEQCRNTALTVLLELDHAIWVWQGDSRGFNADELYTRITCAEENDPIPHYTQNLFMRLGSRCVSHLNLKSQDLNLEPALAAALRQLAKLERIRDFSRDFDFRAFKDILASAVPLLAASCKIDPPRIVALHSAAHRITSEEHQHYRHFGRQVDGTQQPLWSP